MNLKIKLHLLAELFPFFNKVRVNHAADLRMTLKHCLGLKVLLLLILQLAGRIIVVRLTSLPEFMERCRYNNLSFGSCLLVEGMSCGVFISVARRQYALFWFG